MKKIIPLFLISLLFACGGNDNPDGDDTSSTDTVSTDTAMVDSIPEIIEYTYDVQFGFANLEGDKILMMNDSDTINPEDYLYTIDENGEMVKIHYEGVQESSENDSHRQTPYNFEESGGLLYSVEGKVSEWNTCLFMTQQFVDEREHMVGHTTQMENNNWDNTDDMIVEEAKEGWKVDEVVFVESYPNNYSAHFVSFNPKEDSVLVSLVFKSDEGGFTYYDFPAIYDEMSTWRVDDGGVFDTDMFEVLAFFQTPDHIEIFTDWHGAEGSNGYLMVSGFSHFEVKRSCYLYAAPL